MVPCSIDKNRKDKAMSEFPRGVVVNFIADDGKSVIDYDHYNFDSSEEFRNWFIAESATLVDTTAVDQSYRLFMEWVTDSGDADFYIEDSSFLVLESDQLGECKYFAILNNSAYSTEEKYQVNFDELGNVYIDQDKD
jgi:hypothetical protein